VGRGGLEGREDSHKVLCGSTEHEHTYTYYVNFAQQGTSIFYLSMWSGYKARIPNLVSLSWCTV